jgi:hypothetical protein
MDTPSFKEDHISQIPALQMLVNLGYTYLSPAEADRQRGGKTTNVLLGRCIAETVEGNQQHQGKCYQNQHFHRR